MLLSSCETLPGVGPALAKKLAQCGIFSLQDLLFHLPYRYQDRTRITAIQDLRPNEHAVIAGRVCKTEVKYGKRMMLYCYVEDKTAVLRLRFFHFNKHQVKQLEESKQIRAFGEAKLFSNQIEMIHPEYQLLGEDETFQVEESLTPIYPGTEGLSQVRLRQLVKLALQHCQAQLENLEWLTEEALQSKGFQPIQQSILCLHNPPPEVSIQTLENGSHPALQRLAFDELVAQNLSMQFARQKRAALKAPSFEAGAALKKQFLQNLPFQLTKAQERVGLEIEQDLQQSKPMLRLVQGDVGSGKTVVAALAALQAIANGYQVALMAPTEILSEQHAENLGRWMGALHINLCRLSGKMKASERRKSLLALAENRCQIVVGTHALFQEEVQFANLGLAIIDEQHRFGVEQRLLLKQKGDGVHQLLMTATPIPRSLAMTQFAHLDLSVLDELPPGRSPVFTAVMSQEKRQPIVLRLQEAIANGRQAYWVCTLIEESEKLQCMAAIATAESLQEQLSTARVGLIHGRLSSKEKEATMAAFKAGEIDLLVATTVIEVGVDVPNASLMIIENAERLGLSQLHQLRGRIGRGSVQSHCILLYQNPLSLLGSQRLQIMRESNDGFLIAEKDLQLRGAGEFLGTRQTGYRQFKIAELPRDKDLLPLLPSTAKNLIQHQAETAQQIVQRWLADAEEFLQG